MRKFKIMIVGWLKMFFPTEDSVKSDEKAKVRKKMESELLQIAAAEGPAREAYWQAHENFKKGHVVGLPADEIKKLEQELRMAQGQLQIPRASFNKRWHELCGEIDLLTRPLRSEIINLLNRYILEVESIQSSYELEKRPDFDVEIHLVENNFLACSKMIDCLVTFRRRVLTMTSVPFTDILKEVEEFEAMANKIDVYEFNKEEVISPAKSLRR